MIPLQLSLRNFLSYNEANLDFTGLSTACICGANGAGKSSLLEGITWAIWGKCRAVSEDDAISNGAMDVRVDFTFGMHEQVCRIIRTRQRNGSGAVEFQIQTSGGDFGTLTQKNAKTTQALIDEYLKIDYETFVNSAYLRQGKANEFMLKKPAERKQILADLLKLDRYEQLSDKAKDSAKQYKLRVEVLTTSLAKDERELERIEGITRERDELRVEIAQLQQLQTNDERELEGYKTTARQRETWQQQLGWEQKRDRELSQSAAQNQTDIQALTIEQTRLEGVLVREDEVNLGYQEYLSLQQQVERLERQFDRHQEAESQQRTLIQQLDRQAQVLELELGKTQTELNLVIQQEGEIATILATSPDVTKGIETLKVCRQKLAEFDRLQIEVLPLQQQQVGLQSKIDRETANIQAQLNQLITREQEIQIKTKEHPQLIAQLQLLDTQIVELDKKKVYQERVKEKGVEKGDRIQRLDADCHNYQRQLVELEKKLELLKTPDASCPLCDRPLDENHWEHVLSTAQKERENLEQQISATQEEQALYSRKQQTLRDEYKELKVELAGYESLREQRGKLQAKLESIVELEINLGEIDRQKQQIEIEIENKTYAIELQAELEEVKNRLQATEYSQQSHALARGDVDKLRWVEIKQAEIKNAERKQQQSIAQKNSLTLKIVEIETNIQQLTTTSDLKIQLETIEREITTLAYDRSYHTQLTTNLRQSQTIELQHQEIQQAKKTYPQIIDRAGLLQTNYEQCIKDRDKAQLEIDRIQLEIANIPDTDRQIEHLDLQLAQRRVKLDNNLPILGSLEQQLTQLQQLAEQLRSQQQQLESDKKEYKVYDELAKAFGKNGIQALVIENILPQLEAESNHILSKLSNNQFHVQFITQKATKASRTKKASIKNAKFIDTLDIIIGDANGSRAYETYSGGEAFRIDFSIRLALAKLLSQRAGTPLQMLIVDEGFGTQDSEGCDRLIAAIEAISDDFACILTVTHMPQFREAFQTRIEVHKTNNGSQIRVVT